MLLIDKKFILLFESKLIIFGTLLLFYLQYNLTNKVIVYRSNTTEKHLKLNLLSFKYRFFLKFYNHIGIYYN